MPNITQFENVTFTVSGQNSQTKTVQVAFSVDPITGIGNASASFTYTGVNGGVDTITASLPSFGLTSNPATVAWQACPSLISVSNSISVGVFHNGQSGGFNVSTPVPFDYTITIQSLYFNTPAAFNIPGFGQNLATSQPGLFQNITPQGSYAGPPEIILENSTATIQDGGNTAFKMVWRGSFVVQQAGNYTFQFTVDDSFLLCIGNGATRVSGNVFNPFGQTSGPYTGFPVLMAANSTASNNAAQSPSPLTGIINFPAPGIYPFEIDYNNFEGPNGFLDVAFNGQTIIIPVALLPAPAQPSPGSGNLVLTPTGGPTNLLIQGQQATLSLTLQNVAFPTQPYIPLLEGSVGQVYVYNDPLNPTFTFPSYYGSTPDGPSAIDADFQLVGDNTAWQGQVLLRWDGGASKFELYYNGSQSLLPGQLFPANVQFTTLTITQDDIAWFDPTGPSYDTFQATSAGGGKFANMPVFYLLNPNYPAGSAVQASPTTVSADGTQKVFTVTLARPLPPLQNNTVMGVTFSGAQPTGVTVTPNLVTISGVANWLASYTVTATWPTAAVASTSTMLFTFTAPSITFLGSLGSGVDLITTSTNYAYAIPSGNQPQAVITLQAAGSMSPTNVSLAELNSGTPVSTAGIGTSTTLTATWISPSNNFTNTTFYITPNGGSRIVLGVVTSGFATITSIGGGRYQAVFSLVADTSGYDDSNVYQFSYVGTCTDNSSVSYLDTNNYLSNNASSGGGGGGGGGGPKCFSGNVRVLTTMGYMSFDDMPSEVTIVNGTGIHVATHVIHEEGTDDLIDMGGDRLVTPGHVMGNPFKSFGTETVWEIADTIFPEYDFERKSHRGRLHDLHVHTDMEENKHYFLDNGYVAHNKVA